MSTAALDAISRRIEILSLDPEQVRAPLTRLARPLLERFDYTPKLKADRIGELAARSPQPTDLEAALREHEDNVREVERATVLDRRVLTRQAAWLRRAHRFLELISGDAADAAIAARSHLAPPLTIAGREEELEPLVELQLGSIDHLIDRASAPDLTLAHRRALLEAARRILLECSAALPLDAAGVEARSDRIASEITRIDRFEGAGVRPRVGLLHQARQALEREDPDLIYASLVALEDQAAATADKTLLDRVQAVLRRLDEDGTSKEARAESIERSVGDALGEPAIAAARRGFQIRRQEPKQWAADRLPPILDHFAPGAERALLAATLAVDGCFDVGGVMSPVRITEWERREVAVEVPTQKLTLLPAARPSDVRDAIVEDPRMILLSLAAGRLLCRRFVSEERIPRQRTVMRGEIRIYVLDGSTSMHGPRARMRDAILVAELATLARRFSERARENRLVMFYRYFTSELEPVVKVDDAESAISAIERIVATIHKGNTDIQRALIESLRLVAKAQEGNPDLARAQIVLVTDGHSPVDAVKVEKMRASVREGIDLGISVIALGEENPALRTIVGEQRRLGLRAFYHFMSDERLLAIDRGELDRGRAIHLIGRRPYLRSGTTLRQELEPLMEELAALEREQRGEEEDPRALERSFSRWFPRLEENEGTTLPPEPGTLERTDLDAMLVMLSVITEVLELVEGTEHDRRADAIDLLARMLPDGGMTPGRWHELIELYPELLREPLDAVDAAARLGMRRRIY